MSKTNIHIYEVILSKHPLGNGIGKTSGSRGLGKKFERKKVRIAQKVAHFFSQTFSLIFFFVLDGTRWATEMADH